MLNTFAASLSALLLAAQVQVADDLGNPVVLPEPARRVVSLAPHVTETLYAAGAAPYVVGAVSHSDYPEAARRLPRVGSYNALDVEGILALEPDLVVAWASGNPAHQIERLRELGLALYVSEPRRMEDVASGIERLGRLVGSAEAPGAAKRFRERQAALARRFADSEPVRVFYQIWHRPLMTVNDAHLISDVIRLCGGRNVFATLPLLAPAIDTEAVLAADPDVIVASGIDEARPDWLDEWKTWPSLRAVRNRHLHHIPPDLIQRHSPRILEGAERMCRILDAVRRAR
ncbi:ABC transporter substrate-binding protein [Sulfurifustis variabilis]|uniref:ABC transporter substrate-binding protein n=1 Tax=Sulfurifustis variabilis TaxID=1675686 RepID=A0A1B4V2H8_9GAMM|nr:cobalamin-binding protein [Sulfurifustis variabilis]BAU47723.1 ABC transporter substrate-binding protein [Sulfurifustis variabilis]